MKNIFIIPVILLLTGCQTRYSSRYEAEKACFKWMNEKPGIFSAWNSYYRMTSRQQDEVLERQRASTRKDEISMGYGDFHIRDCIEEKETSQYLGFYYEGVKDKDEFHDKLPVNPNYNKNWRHRKGNPPAVKIRNFRY